MSRGFLGIDTTSQIHKSEDLKQNNRCLENQICTRKIFVVK